MNDTRTLVPVFRLPYGSKDSAQSDQQGLEAVPDSIPDTEMPIDYDKELEDGYQFKYGKEP